MGLGMGGEVLGGEEGGDCGAGVDGAAGEADYEQFAGVAEFREYLAELPAKQPLAVWLNLEIGERESEGVGTRIASIEGSPNAGQGRSVWYDEKREALKAHAPLLRDPKRPKIVHH